MIFFPCTDQRWRKKLSMTWEIVWPALRKAGWVFSTFYRIYYILSCTQINSEYLSVMSAALRIMFLFKFACSRDPMMRRFNRLIYQLCLAVHSMYYNRSDENTNSELGRYAFCMFRADTAPLRKSESDLREEKQIENKRYWITTRLT